MNREDDRNILTNDFESRHQAREDDRIVATAGALQSEEVEQTWRQACASNVSPQVTVTRGGYRLNRATNTFSQTVTVANAGGALADAVLVLDGLSANATLQNPSGTTACALPAGSPFVALPALGTGQSGMQRLPVPLTVGLRDTRNHWSAGSG